MSSRLLYHDPGPSDVPPPLPPRVMLPRVLNRRTETRIKAKRILLAIGIPALLIALIIIAVYFGVVHKWNRESESTPEPVEGTFKCRCQGPRCDDIPKAQHCNGVRNCAGGSDEADCAKGQCFGNFQCENGECIARHFRCDYVRDCSDGSDEMECDAGDKCPGGFYPCKGQGRCIEHTQHCDVRNDCGDDSDESACGECDDSQFTCKSPYGLCIPKSWLCDGHVDCHDGADEQQACACKADEYRCLGGGCVSRQKRCNGVVDCPDGSDERLCFRLKGHSHEGQVEVFWESTWRPICSSPWAEEYSDEVCRELGYPSALFQNTSTRSSSSESVSIMDDRDGPLRTRLISSASCTAGAVNVVCERAAHTAESVSNTEWPWLMVLVNVKHPERQHFGILIEPQWILTASSINSYLDERADDWVALAHTSRGQRMFQVHVIKKHPRSQFYKVATDFDAALVQLSQPINASSDIRPVHISRDPPKSGRLCRVPLKDKVPLFSNDTRPSVTSLPVPLLSVAECNAEGEFNSWMTGRMGCAKRVEDNRLCQDVLGTPLVCDGPKKEIYLEGFLEQQTICGRPRTPYIFTRIDTMHAWIDNVIGLQRSCGLDEFVCQDTTGIKCLAKYKACDGIKDCYDGSDEINCDRTNCSFSCKDSQCVSAQDALDGAVDCADGSDEEKIFAGSKACRGFRCPNGGCIPLDRVCDGSNDCYDWEDEKQNCLCPNGQNHKCGDGLCIDARWRCDGRFDCTDQSDEADCVACRAGQFKCTAGPCVSSDVRCDGQPDCPDWSDEMDCIEIGPSEGLLYVMKGGKKTIVCADDWKDLYSDMVCQQLLFSHSSATQYPLSNNLHNQPTVKLNPKTPTNSVHGVQGLLTLPGTCMDNQVVRISCSPLQCGRKVETKTSHQYGAGHMTSSLLEHSIYKRDVAPSIGKRDVAPSGRWPWVVAMLHHGAVLERCSAVLISKTWILFSATCLHERSEDVDTWQALLGITHLHKDIATREVRHLTRIVHPLKQTPHRLAIEEGIALAELDRPVPFNEHIQPICLPSNAEHFSAHTCYITGWSNQEKIYTTSGIAQDTLMATQVTPWSRENCEKIYSTTVLTKSLMCIGNTTAELHPLYQSVRGAPVMCQDHRRQWVLAGIGSMTSYRKKASFPVLATNMTFMAEWVLQIIS